MQDLFSGAGIAWRDSWREESVVVMDTIGNMLTSIRNGLSVNAKAVVTPYSKLNFEIVRALIRVGFVAGINVEERPLPGGTKRQVLVIDLAYDTDGAPKIAFLRRESTPGRRVMIRAADLARVAGGHRTVILSSSSGILTSPEARKSGVGGELICTVW